MSRLTTAAEVEVAVRLRCDLGEGPVWDADNGELLCVDILGACFYRLWPETGAIKAVGVGEPVGAVAPRRDGGYVLAVRDGFAFLDEANQMTAASPVEADRPSNRMNDGKCDGGGRFWAGTQAEIHESHAGALYRMDPDLSVTQILTDVTISNGLGWSPDGGTMYFIDTGERSVDAFDFDVDDGTITNRRRIVCVPAEAGAPDGMAVDSEGGLWVALWGGGAVRRYDAAGMLTAAIALPVSLVTSCAFGGEDLRDLYITTAARDHEDEPLAGSVFRCRPGVAGLPSQPFGG